MVKKKIIENQQYNQWFDSLNNQQKSVVQLKKYLDNLQENIAVYNKEKEQEKKAKLAQAEKERKQKRELGDLTKGSDKPIDMGSILTTNRMLVEQDLKNKSNKEKEHD